MDSFTPTRHCFVFYTIVARSSLLLRRSSVTLLRSVVRFSAARAFHKNKLDEATTIPPQSPHSPRSLRSPHKHCITESCVEVCSV